MDRLNLKRFRAIVFDLFHTLTSLDPLETGPPPTSRILGVSRKDWNEQLHSHSDDRLRGRITDPYEIVRELAHRIDPAIPEDTVREATRGRVERFGQLLMQIDGSVLATLRRLKADGKLVGLVSNADVMEISRWNDSPLSDCFDEVAFSCRTGYVKPERRAYLSCLDGLEVPPSESLFVGDGGSNELRGARDVGMTTVLVTHVVRSIWPEVVETRREFADYQIERIDELLGGSVISCRKSKRRGGSN